MGLLTLRPARGKYASSDSPVVADLDALTAEPIHFKFQGNKHTIYPFTQVQFLRVMNRYSDIVNRVQEKKLDREERNQLYADLFGQCCATIGRREVDMMTDPQIGALMQLIIDSVTGRIQGEAGKDQKKKVNTPLT